MKLSVGVTCKYLCDDVAISEVYPCRGGFRIWERGGLINIFTSGGGYGRGRAPSIDSKGSGAKPQPLFCFCVYLA